MQTFAPLEETLLSLVGKLTLVSLSNRVGYPW